MAIKKPINPLTGLRGVAAIYVVLYHGFDGSMTNPVNTLSAHGYLAVDLFFMLSGFVMALNYTHMFEGGFSRASYFKFLGRRLARVYPLYFVVSLCGLILLLIGRPHDVNLFSPWRDVGANLTMIQVWAIGPSLDGPGWSISAEWAAYLLFPCLLIPTMFRKPALAVAMFLFSLACVGTLCVLPASATHNPHPVRLLNIYAPNLCLPVLRCLAEFSMGIVAFRVSSSSFGVMIGQRKWITFILCAACIIFLTIPRADFFFVLTVPLLLVALSTGDHLPQRLLSSAPAMFSGDISYSMYLVYGLSGGLLAWVVRHADAQKLHHARYPAVAACLILLFPLVLLAYNLIEKPGRKWLRQVFEGGPSKYEQRAGDGQAIDASQIAASS